MTDNVRIGVLGDWGNNCSKEQVKVLESLKSESLDMIISVGDMLYHDSKPSGEKLAESIQQGFKCIVDSELNKLPWSFVFGNHDEPSFKIQPPCTYRNALISNIESTFNLGNPEYQLMFKNYVDTDFSENTKFLDSHNLVILNINTNIFEMKSKKGKIEPECTYAKNKEFIDHLKSLDNITKKDNLSNLASELNNRNKNPNKNDTFDEQKVLKYLSEIKTVNLLKNSLNYYERLNIDRRNNKIKVIIVGHHPMIMKGHKKGKLHKFYGNIFMKFIYENIIRNYNCCIAYLSGHEHGLQMLEDITNVTSNKDTFKFIISGSGGGNSSLNNTRMMNNKDKNLLINILTRGGYRSLTYKKSFGYWVINLKSNKELSFNYKIVPMLKGGGNKTKTNRKNSSKINIINKINISRKVKKISNKKKSRINNDTQ